MRSQCRSNRDGKAVTRRTRIALTRIAGLTLLLAAGSGCTRTGVAMAPKTDESPSDALNPTTWSLTAHKRSTVDPGTTASEQPDAGNPVAIAPTTPVSPTPGSDGPNSQVDPIAEAPPVVDEEPAPVATPTATLIFNESATTHVAPSVLQGFSVKSVRELFIHTIWSNLKGAHTETRKFYSPSGELYYEKLTPFSTEIDAPLPFEQPVSIPHASSIQATPLNSKGNAVVTDYLSVGGTWISDRSMTGIWTVEIYLDDATKPSFTDDLELVP